VVRALLLTTVLLSCAAAPRSASASLGSDRVQEPPPAQASGRDHELMLQLGVYHVLDATQWGLIGAEYRLAPVPRWWDVRPIVGAYVIAGGNNYAYAGLRRDFSLWGDVEFSATTAVGLYDRGTVDLGGPIEFRSGADFTWPVGEGLRLGIGYYHMSNAILYDRNPGSDTVQMSLVWEL
jgi:hypothetical protein